MGGESTSTDSSMKASTNTSTDRGTNTSEKGAQRKLTIPEEELMYSGHMACLGCGAAHAMRYALKALGRNTIMTIPACCWAVIPGVLPFTCMSIPTLSTAFETTGVSISGVRAALDARGVEGITVVGWAGDGGTADIGIQALSGAAERDDDVIYFMYDNEAYMNTGIQQSGSTPVGAWTTTTPVGTTGEWEKSPKKKMVEILAAHRIPYAATASIAYPEDLIRKVRKAKEIKGFKFIHIYAPCPTGWKSDPSRTVEIARMAVQTKLFPLYEVENGVYRITMKPKGTPIEDYLRIQGRFRHLPEEVIEYTKRTLENEWNRLLKLEEFTKELKESEG